MKLLASLLLACSFASAALANPHPPIPPQAVPHSDAGKVIFNDKCATCHTGGAASNPYDILSAANPNMWDIVKQQAAGHDPVMMDNINSLTPQQLDDLSVYLADQDPSYFTLQGKVTQNGNPLSGVRVIMTTEYKMGTNLYFPAVQVLTDPLGRFSFKTWAGRKALSVSKANYIFMPSQRNNIGLTSDIADFGTYSQGDIQVTGSHGADGPILSGEIFKTLQMVKVQVSESLPWLLGPQP
ncbi:MAG: cytochrome c [Vulcanimicrobiota bacterium]